MPHLATRAEKYICPGQTHSISRSVHLARLAAWYPACADCAFRHDTGALRVDSPDGRDDSPRTATDGLLRCDGFRGRHRNEFDRQLAARLAAAFAAILWERVGNRSEIPAPPRILVGYDQRLASPDILAGVVDGLKRMSAHAIDVGSVSYPHFVAMAVRLRTDGGLLITGAGRGPSWTGLDVIGPDAAPISRAARDISLEELHRRAQQPLNRPSRAAGKLMLHRDADDYQRSLAPHFHALRPLRVVVATATTSLRNIVERVFAPLPCTLSLVDLPLRERRIDDPEDADADRLRRAVVSNTADVGLLMDEDGQSCTVCDETGRIVPTIETTAWLAAHVIAEGPNGPLVIGESFDESWSADIGRAAIVRCAESRAAMHAMFEKSHAIFAAASNGRYWFRSEETGEPVCDALLTLANVLAALSRSDATCSALVAPHSHDDDAPFKPDSGPTPAVVVCASG